MRDFVDEQRLDDRKGLNEEIPPPLFHLIDTAGPIPSTTR